MPKVCLVPENFVTIRSRARFAMWQDWQRCDHCPRRSLVLPEGSPAMCVCGAPAKRIFCSDACRQASYRTRQQERQASSPAFQNLCQRTTAIRVDASNRKFASQNRHRVIEFDGRYAGSEYEFALKHGVKVPAEVHLIGTLEQILEGVRSKTWI